MIYNPKDYGWGPEDDDAYRWENVDTRPEPEIPISDEDLVIDWPEPEEENLADLDPYSFGYGGGI